MGGLLAWVTAGGTALQPSNLDAVAQEEALNCAWQLDSNAWAPDHGALQNIDDSRRLTVSEQHMVRGHGTSVAGRVIAGVSNTFLYIARFPDSALSWDGGLNAAPRQV